MARLDLVFCISVLLLFGGRGFADPADGTAANAPLFDYEKKQLTDGAVDRLPARHRKLFGFDDSAVNSAISKPRERCKAFPGDNDWPSGDTWVRFDELVDGALIPTIPLAAPCYKNWRRYDAAKCAAIAKSFTNPYLQYGPNQANPPYFHRHANTVSAKR